MTKSVDPAAPDPLKELLQDFSIQTVPGDPSLAEASARLPPGTKVFIASVPDGSIDSVVAAALRLRSSRLVPVPHLAARDIRNAAELESILRRLARTAAVTDVLVIAGDRSEPAGEYGNSIDIIRSGLLEAHGVRTIYIGCYPEGHPTISDGELDDARAAKLTAARQAGLDVALVSQFCFAAAPIIDLARRLRSIGIEVPFRAGVAGPTSGPTLLKYARKFGVESAERALSGRSERERNIIAMENPTAVARDLARAQAADPELGIHGVHFFTFGSAARSTSYAVDVLADGFDDQGNAVRPQ